MKNISKFLSTSKYIILPTKSKPKVILAIDNSDIKSKSFCLYNPFSIKAKLLKKFAYYSPFIFFTDDFTYRKKGEFIQFLKEKFKEDLVSSIYIATDRKKYVLQIQSRKGEILAYVKITNNEIGKIRLDNEIQAYKNLSSLNLPFKLVELAEYGYFHDYLYIIYKPLTGKNLFLKEENIQLILKSLKKKGKFKIKEHPGFVILRDFFWKKTGISHKLQEYIFSIIEKIEKKDIILGEVFEHGDFAPWNLINTENKLYIIDWEFFEKNGIEYLDYIKYYYQLFKLLKKHSEEKLLCNLRRKLNIDNFEIIFTIFLLKEIKNKMLDNADFDFELSLINKILKKGCK